VRALKRCEEVGSGTPSLSLLTCCVALDKSFLFSWVSSHTG
jgi:hypothetical protein